MSMAPTYRGTARQPFVSVNEPETRKSGGQETLIVLSAILVTISVVLIYMAVHRDDDVVTGPVLSVHPDIGADLPQLDNITQTVVSIADRTADGL